MNFICICVHKKEQNTRTMLTATRIILHTKTAERYAKTRNEKDMHAHSQIEFKRQQCFQSEFLFHDIES